MRPVGAYDLWSDNKIKPIAIALVGLLILGAFSDSLPYAYYDFLRLATTAGAGFMMLAFWRNGHVVQAVGCAAIALAFNPFAPLDMDKDEWFIVDIAAAIFIVAVGFRWPASRRRLIAIGWRKLACGVAALAACIVALASYRTLAVDGTSMFWGVVISIYALSGVLVLSAQSNGEKPTDALPGSRVLRDWEEKDKRGARWGLIWSVGLVALLGGVWLLSGGALNPTAFMQTTPDGTTMADGTTMESVVDNALDPFEYLDSMRAQASRPVQGDDSFEAELRRQRDAELAYRIKVAKPDEAARD